MKEIVVLSCKSAQDMVRNADDASARVAVCVAVVCRCPPTTCRRVDVPQVEDRKSSFEIYGYDFMIDADFSPWLIEINSSPDFSYSTEVTKQLVKVASDDIVKVIVDHRCVVVVAVVAVVAVVVVVVVLVLVVVVVPHRVCASACVRLHIGEPLGVGVAARRDFEAESKRKGRGGRAASPPGTGQWECVHRAKHTVTRPLGCLAHDFICQGAPTPIGPPRRRKPKP
jgi:hypothetical protein